MNTAAPPGPYLNKLFTAIGTCIIERDAFGRLRLVRSFIAPFVATAPPIRNKRDNGA
jgi:hypothetical protein